MSLNKFIKKKKTKKTFRYFLDCIQPHWSSYEINSVVVDACPSNRNKKLNATNNNISAIECMYELLVYHELFLLTIKNLNFRYYFRTSITPSSQYTPKV